MFVCLDEGNMIGRFDGNGDGDRVTNCVELDNGNGFGLGLGCEDAGLAE